MMVLRLAGDVGVHMALELQSPRNAGIHQPLDGAEDGGASEGRLRVSNEVVELCRRELAPGTCQGLSDEQPLLRHPLAGRGEAGGGGIDHGLTLT